MTTEVLETLKRIEEIMLRVERVLSAGPGAFVITAPAARVDVADRK